MKIVMKVGQGESTCRELGISPGGGHVVEAEEPGRLFVDWKGLFPPPAHLQTLTGRLATSFIVVVVVQIVDLPLWLVSMPDANYDV